MRRGQATLELLIVVAIILGIATGVARLAGRELVRAQAEHAIDRALQAEVAGDRAPATAALAALPAVLRQSAHVGVAGRSITVTVDPPGPIGRVRVSAPSVGRP